MKLYKRGKSLLRNNLLGYGQAKYHDFFDEHEFLFIHIPKTGGLSVLSSLIGHEERVGHSKAIQYRKLDKNRFNSYYKFAFVRNPWDRFLSSFLFLKKGGINKYDKKWADIHLTNFETLDDFIQSLTDLDFQKKVLSWKHFVPQHEFICDLNNNLIINAVYKFEDINQGYNAIRKQLGFGKELIEKNRSRPESHDFREYYKTPEAISFVELLYETDIKLFNYSFR